MTGFSHQRYDLSMQYVSGVTIQSLTTNAQKKYCLIIGEL